MKPLIVAAAAAFVGATLSPPIAAENDHDDRAYLLCEELLRLKLAEPDSYRLLGDVLTEPDATLHGQTTTRTRFAFRAARHGDFLAGVHVAQCRVVWDGSTDNLGSFDRVAYFTIDGTKVLIPTPELELLSDAVRTLDTARE